MAHPVDTHNANLVCDFVYHPIIAYSYPPVTLAPRKLPATRRSRIVRQTLNREDNSIVDYGRKAREILLGGPLDEYPIHDYLAFR